MLITGGAGKLGTAIAKLLPDAIVATRTNFDITDAIALSNFLDAHKGVDTIIHCAAMISPPKIKENPSEATRANIIGTALLSNACFERNIRLVYISTDYVFSGDNGNYKESSELLPQNKYAWSKLGGECAVQMLDNFVIIRLSFGPDIFPYKAAFTDQFTSRESASAIALKIKQIACSNFNGIIHIGGTRKSVFDYALSLGAENIEQISIKDMSVKMPVDTSLDCSLYNSLFQNNN